MNSQPTQDKSRWHISREIPLSLVYTLVAQFIIVLLLAAGVKSTVDDHERRISTMESQKLAERIVALEQQMKDAKQTLDKIDAKLDRLLERNAPQ